MSAGEVIEGARRRPRGGRYRKSSIGATATWPLAARAQQTMPVVGFLSSGSHAARSNLLPFFSRGMSEIGYIEAVTRWLNIGGHKAAMTSCHQWRPI